MRWLRPPSLGWGLPLAGGLALRLGMLKQLFEVSGDSLIYGALAKTLLDGRYGLEMAGTTIYPTLIRLPGYPLFLALCFRFLGMEDYFRATMPQIALELLGCLLLADFAGRIAPPHLKRGARLATLWLACLCPFTASYAVVPLTEAPTLFSLALAMWAMARFRDRPGWATALLHFRRHLCRAAAARWRAGSVAFVPALAIAVGRRQTAPAANTRAFKLVAIGLVCTLLALAPFAAWTLRNWRVFHVVEPLAPRYAVDPGESSNPGWQRWVKTWCLDFTSTYKVYWKVPGDPLDISRCPAAPSTRLHSTRRLPQSSLTTTTGPRQLYRPISTRALPRWPRSGSPPIPCAITLFCPSAAWPTWLCGLALKT